VNPSETPVTAPGPAATPAPAKPTSTVPQGGACWNAVGVWGNGSCSELAKVVHCHNCAVYSKAGVQLLNRPLPPAYRREWTEHFATAKRLPEPGNTSAVPFRIESEWLALPTEAFQEAAERRPIHSLPGRPDGLVLGLANVRGELLICVSFGHLLGLDKLAPTELLRSSYHRLLVANWKGHRFAFPVDEVQGPLRFHPRDLKAPPATVAKSNTTFTRGLLYWQDRAIGCLDADLLFSTLNRSLT
jgi:chemotaxis-related protein WspD